MTFYDLLAHALTLPPAIAWGLDLTGRRALWGRLGLLAAGAATLASAFISGFVFAPMRVLANVVFVALPLALALAAARASRSRYGTSRAAAPSSLGRVPPWAFALAACLIVATGVDAFFIEPQALEIDRHEVRSSRVDARIRFVIIADLQFDEWGEHERRAIDLAADEKPDVVLFPGDFVQQYGPQRNAVLGAARDHLAASALDPPLGSYAVEGNIEVGGWQTMFPPRMTTLSSRAIERGPIRVEGLTLGESFDRTLRIPRRSEAFTVVLGHAPDFSLGEIDADLLVAGHTHGGQVQLPWLGPLVTFSAVPRIEAAGGVFARVGGGHLVVSRGVGMERGDAPRLRFLCHPQIVVIDVVPNPG